MAGTTIGDGGRPALSAIVFGYRNEDTILRAVRSLMEQESDEPFEVIVATSGGDRSAALVRETYPSVRVAESPTRLLPGGVRNLGTALATGDVVGYLEADCVARPGWVQRRIDLHRAGHEAVASALDAMASDGRVARAALYLVHPARLAGHRAGPADEYQAYGLSFTRELLERAGPFDETLRSYEDTAMAERLRFLGVEPWFEPSVCIEHDGPDSLRHLVHDQFVRGGRDSWAELLRLPAGRHRHRWEVAPATRAPVVTLRALYRLWRRVRSTVVALRHGGTGPPGELAGLALPMVLGMLAYQLGWTADQLRGARRANDGPARDQLPTPRGLRRWVTTDGERVVALTFDGVPSPASAARLLSTLRAESVPAAFFVTGSEAHDRPDEVRAFAADGHVVGSSGWNGAPFPSLPDDQLRDELARTGDLLGDLTGQPVGDSRPPEGNYDWRVVSSLEALGLRVWLWTTHPAALAPGSGPGQVAAHVMDHLTPGAVIALPVSGSREGDVVAAVSAVIEGVRQRQYQFVSLNYLPPAPPGAGPDASPASPAPSSVA